MALQQQPVGQRYGVEFQYPGDRSPTTRYGWKLSGGPHYGQWLLLSVLFFAVLTQYAIALELRLAYCGLQNANLDLQVTYCRGWCGLFSRTGCATDALHTSG